MADLFKTAAATAGSAPSLVGLKRASMSVMARTQLDELEAIKIKTMYQMVEDIQVSDRGRQVSKKLLFLTTKQAASFNNNNIKSVVQALELRESHFIIRLMPSYGGKAGNKAHKERKGNLTEMMNKAPELNHDDAHGTESQMVLFVKHCILPVAMQTQALILIGGIDDDTLSMAVQKVMGPVQKRLGKDCPFTIVGFCSSNEVHAKAKNDSSKSGQYRSQSKSWSAKFAQIDETLMDVYDGNQTLLQQCDINTCCSHLVVFEGMNHEKATLNHAARIAFTNTFVEFIAAKLPSVVIQSHKTKRSSFCGLADIARREVPIILLDPRERWPALKPYRYGVQCGGSDDCPFQGKTELARMTKALMPPANLDDDSFDRVETARERLKAHIETLVEKGNNGKGVFDSWNSGTVAFLKAMVRVVKRKKRKVDQDELSLAEAIEVEQGDASGIGSAKALDADLKTLTDLYFDCRKKWNNPGKLRIAERFIALRDAGTFNNSDDEEEDDEDDDDGDDGESDKQQLTEKQKRELREKEQAKEAKTNARNAARQKAAESRAARAASDAQVIPNDEFEMSKTGVTVPSNGVEYVPPDHLDTFSDRPTTMDSEEMQQKMWQDEKDRLARKRLASLREVQRKIDNNLALERDIEEWLAVYDILASPSVFAQSVYNLIGINHIMNDVAKIDNLPDKHTIEALLLLRHAWSNVDAYTYYANHYKKIAKFCYFMMLLLGILIVSMGVMLFNSDNIMGIDRTNANLITLGLSLASAIVAGYTSFMNPAARWHHLRSSALTLESEIWQFRTRTGKFRQNDLDARLVETSFKTSIKDVENSMLSGGDLKRTNFYSTPDSVWSAHGQFKKSGVAGCCARCCSRKKKSLVSPTSTINNHHSPVKPDDYIRFRLKPAMNFYRSRIPTYARAHSFATLIMIVGSLAGGCLAFYDYAIWVGMLSSFTSAVVAWCEFSGTEKKLDRYSNIVISLKSINLWWDSLPEVERLATKNINLLIQTVEREMRTERSGWRATSDSMKKIKQAVAKINNNKENSSSAGNSNAPPPEKS